MASATITPEFQRANAEAILGRDPGRGNDMASAARKYTMSLYKQKLREITQLGKGMPVTILNMNPFPLKINGGVLFPDEVAACPLGTAYVTYVIRDTAWQSKDNGCDIQGMMQMEPVPYVPLTLAAEYIREFMQMDTAFGGVMCYVGDADPATLSKAIVDVPELSYDKDELFVDTHKRSFSEIYAKVKGKQKSSILRVLQRANSWYENDHQRHFVNDTHRDLARLAKAEGYIEELPRWVMQDTQDPTPVEPCPACRVEPKAGAIICVNCSHVFDIVAAYKLARIAYGSVDMDRLDAAGWAEVDKIKAERDKIRAKKAIN